MDTTTQAIALIIILITFVLNALVRRRQRTPMRPIKAFDAIPDMTGESIEASRPLHVSIGAASLGEETTIVTLVGREFIYYLTREVAIGDAPPIFTVADTAAIPLAMATLQRAYTDENRTDAFTRLSTRWYPSQSRTLAFAAAITAMQNDDQLSGNVLTGRYGAELALILDASNRYDRPSIAMSDLLAGQAVAVAMSKEALIGEEVFAAPGYLSDDVRLVNRNLVTDGMRYVLIAAIFIWMVLLLISGNGG